MPDFLQLDDKRWINMDRIREVHVENTGLCFVNLVDQTEAERIALKGDEAKELIAFLRSHQAKK